MNALLGVPLRRCVSASTVSSTLPPAAAPSSMTSSAAHFPHLGAVVAIGTPTSLQSSGWGRHHGEFPRTRPRRRPHLTHGGRHERHVAAGAGLPVRCLILLHPLHSLPTKGREHAIDPNAAATVNADRSSAPPTGQRTSSRAGAHVPDATRPCSTDLDKR
jgi:hypothetical protein